MGARGTKPKENAAANAGSLRPLALEPPEWMKGGGDARDEYRRIAAELVKLGHLSDLNRQSLVNYCEAWVIAGTALEKVKEEGVTLESLNNGNQYMHPALSAWSMARGVMETEAKNLGMTPLSLQSIKAVKPAKTEKKEGLSQFLTGGDG